MVGKVARWSHELNAWLGPDGEPLNDSTGPMAAALSELLRNRDGAEQAVHKGKDGSGLSSTPETQTNSVGEGPPRAKRATFARSLALMAAVVLIAAAATVSFTGILSTGDFRPVKKENVAVGGPDLRSIQVGGSSSAVEGLEERHARQTESAPEQSKSAAQDPGATSEIREAQRAEADASVSAGLQERADEQHARLIESAPEQQAKSAPQDPGASDDIREGQRAEVDTSVAAVAQERPDERQAIQVESAPEQHAKSALQDPGASNEIRVVQRAEADASVAAVVQERPDERHARQVESTPEQSKSAAQDTGVSNGIREAQRAEAEASVAVALQERPDERHARQADSAPEQQAKSAAQDPGSTNEIREAQRAEADASVAVGLQERPDERHARQTESAPEQQAKSALQDPGNTNEIREAQRAEAEASASAGLQERPDERHARQTESAPEQQAKSAPQDPGGSEVREAQRAAADAPVATGFQLEAQQKAQSEAQGSDQTASLSSPDLRASRLSWQAFDDPTGTRLTFPGNVFSEYLGPTEQGSGKRFRTADGRAQLAIFSLPNEAGERPRTYLRDRLTVPLRSIKYRRITGRSYVLSDEQDGSIYYRRCNFVRRSLHCIHMTYPAQDKRAWAPIVARVSNSLKASR